MLCARLVERIIGTTNERRRRGEEEAGLAESGERTENGDHQQSYAAAIAATTAAATVATVGIAIWLICDNANIILLWILKVTRKFHMNSTFSNCFNLLIDREKTR